VIGVDRRPRVVPRRLRTAPLLGGSRLRTRRETRDLELDLAPVARRQLRGLGFKRLSRDGAHASRLLLPREAVGGNDDFEE
jgi:hypothetical protein